MMKFKLALITGLMAVASGAGAQETTLTQTPGKIPAPPPTAAATPVISPDGSLYRTFGEREGLVRLVDDFMDTLMKDERTKPFFEPFDRIKLKGLLVEQFCQILGGPCTYSGRDMSTVHSQLGIKQEDFYALVEDLQKAMDKNKIPFAAQNRLLAALAPQSRDIIYKVPK